MKKNVLLVFVSVVLLSAMLPITKESTSFSEATIYVDPSTNDVSVGNAFVVNLSLADYIWLQNFEFYLGYDTTILDGLNVLVPPPYMAPVEPQINDTEGYVHVIAVHEGPIPSSASASESFPLASITFKATAVGSSILDLYDTLLFGGLGTYINHTTVDGSVTVSSGIITVPDDYPTIQEAVDVADPGDTIIVRAGTYIENVKVNKGHLTIKSVDGIDKTIVQAANPNDHVFVVMANCVEIRGFTVEGATGRWGPTGYGYAGIYLIGANYCKILNNKVCNNSNGFYLDKSSNNNSISDNDVYNFSMYGIRVKGFPSGGPWKVPDNESSINNVVSNNSVHLGYIGIDLYLANKNTVTSNRIHGNNIGIYIDASHGNAISNNSFYDNEEGWGKGILLHISTNNTLTDNNVASNKFGISLGDTSNNVIYHNRFIDNTENVEISATGTTYIDPFPIVFDSKNIWDNGYPSGGNYWSDYNGTDANHDGVGDTPYVINGANQDKYPLMSPWTSLPVHNINMGLGYTTIQEAINASETLDGHTIFVEAGTYHENVIVSKSISLVGENKVTTTIDGSMTATVVVITADNVTISQFTIRNGGDHYAGICLSSNGNNITNNIIWNNWCGISLEHYSAYNVIADNSIMNNLNGISGELWSDTRIIGNTLRDNLLGIWIGPYSKRNTIAFNNIRNHWSEGISMWQSSYNTIVGNNIMDNNQGGHWAGIVVGFSSYNQFFHNNIANKEKQIDVQGEVVNVWDDGYPSGGNCWSDYTGVDVYSGPNQDETGSDGVGDKSHVINTDNTDRYPLMGPISFFNTCTWDETTYYVHTVSNSTISDFYFSRDDKLVSFNATGPDDTVGFCRVTIPNELLWCDNPEQWQVWVNNTLIEDKKITEDPHYTHIYFTYNHSSQNVEVIGVHVTPEFPTWTSMLLILIMLTVAIAIYKRRIPKTPIH